MPRCAPLRFLRAGVITAAVLGLASAAHIAGGGHLPPVPVLLTVPSLTPVMLLSRYRLGFPALTGIVTAGQGLLHLAFGTLSSSGGHCTAPGILAHGHHRGSVVPECAIAILDTGGASVGHAMASWPVPAMFAAHALAVGATVVLLAQGETALCQLVKWLKPLVRIVRRAALLPRTRLPLPQGAAVPVSHPALRNPPLRGPPASGTTCHDCLLTHPLRPSSFIACACPRPAGGCPERTPMSFSLLRALMTGTATAAVALTGLLGAVPAQAHDALSSTSPANGEAITTNPGKVSITLTKAPETKLAGSNIIKVTAPDGHIASTGDTTADGSTLSIAADIDHPGEHKVEWRAVSADGHPIEGTFIFTYTEPGSESQSAASATLSPSAAATTSTAAESTPQPSSQAAAHAQATDNTGLLIGAGIVILALIAAVIYLLSRRIKNAAA